MNTNELAEYLATEEGLSVVRSLQGLGVLGARPGARIENGRIKNDHEPLSILEWKPVKRGDALAFERADFYRCKPKSISAEHSGVIRIGIFGESMAAGFPLAPAFTPALLLQDTLLQDTLLQETLRARNGSEGRSIEVLDFAMPNMGPSEQLRVCEAAMQLRPDVCIFMTGNNWYYGLPVEPTASPDARATYARHLGEGGINALRNAFRSALEARASVMVKTMIDAARSAGAHPIVVIPASNHAWERRNPVPWIGEAETAEWFARLAKADSALAECAWEIAIAEATKMETLEGGLSGTPQRILAKALLAQGRRGEARDAAMRAIDASNWHNYSWALPQTPSYVADAMRATAAELGALCIDLDAVLVAHTGSPYLDFRMFYDQCHLTAEGTQVAMRAVAEKVSSVLPDRGPDHASSTRASHASGETVPQPSAVIAASAAFQAAHWMSQFYPAFDARELETKLRDALNDVVAKDESFVAVLKDQLRVKSIAASPGLNAALPAAARVPGVAASLLSPRLNAPFFAAIVGLLEARGDRDVGAIVDHVIAGYESRFDDGLDIAQTIFRAWFWERTPLAWNDPCERQGSPFYRASWPVSHFDFLASGTRALDVELVARPGAFVGTASLSVNDVSLAGLDLGKDWKRLKHRISPQSIRRGPNRMTVAWPSLSTGSSNGSSNGSRSRGDESPIDRAKRRFAIGADGDLFPVFGEVFTLRLRTASAS